MLTPSDIMELSLLLSQLETPKSRTTQSCISKKQVETMFESFYVFCINLCHQLELLQVVQFYSSSSFIALLPFIKPWPRSVLSHLILADGWSGAIHDAHLDSFCPGFCHLLEWCSWHCQAWSWLLSVDRDAQFFVSLSLPLIHCCPMWSHMATKGPKGGWGMYSQLYVHGSSWHAGTSVFKRKKGKMAPGDSFLSFTHVMITQNLQPRLN